jgi:hypothetical protein
VGKKVGSDYSELVSSSQPRAVNQSHYQAFL